MSSRKKYIPSTDLKTILHSKRANIYYLEYCRLLVNGGRVEYVTDEKKRSVYWNIPIANTTVILLGNGTSVTQAAMRELAKAGVMIGFCGGGGAPLFAASDGPAPSLETSAAQIQTADTVEVAWLEPQSEYRSPTYLQAWVQFWFQPEGRLKAAQRLQKARLERIKQTWLSETMRRAEFHVDALVLTKMLEKAEVELQHVPDVTALLTAEARLTKQLFRLAAETVGYGTFTRGKQGSGQDRANRFLDHGNYLAYGLGATVAWVLGLPFGLAVMHGTTRRGGLVFDFADLIKDAHVLPQAFLSAQAGDSEQQFRAACLRNFLKTEALDFMFEVVEDIALSRE